MANEFSDNIKRAELSDAIAIAADVHKFQKDRSGESYILHPLRMMMRMQTDEERMVAILHDVIEDSSADDKWDVERLVNAGISEKVAEAVDCLSKKEGESYEEFIERGSVNPLARKIKLADLEDNMNILRLNEVGTKDLERLQKYHKAYKYLKKVESGK